MTTPILSITLPGPRNPDGFVEGEEILLEAINDLKDNLFVLQFQLDLLRGRIP